MSFCLQKKERDCETRATGPNDVNKQNVVGDMNRFVRFACTFCAQNKITIYPNISTRRR